MTIPMVQTWFDLPPGARDWLRPGELHGLWLPRGELSSTDLLNGYDVLAQWDQLVGRMFRARLFDDTEDPRALRLIAEAVAAVAEALAVRLGEVR